MIVRHSVSAVVVTLIHTHMPDELLNRNRKIQLSIAAWAVGGVASDKAASWAGRRVASYVTLATGLVQAVKGNSESTDDSWSTATAEPTE